MGEELPAYVTTPDPREAKLPGWASNTLNALRRDMRFLDAENARLRGELDLRDGQGPADSNTFVDLEGGTLALGRSTPVRFVTPGGHEFDVKLGADGLLEVDIITGRLAVLPWVANAIRLRGEKP